MNKTKVKKIVIIICLSVGAIVMIATIVNYLKFISVNKHCMELIKLIDEFESPYCKFEFDEIYVYNHNNWLDCFVVLDSFTCFVFQRLASFL